MIRAIIFDWHGVLEKRTFVGLLRYLAWDLFKMFLKGKFSKLLIDEILEYIAGHTRSDKFWFKLECDYGEELAKKAKEYVLNLELSEDLWNLIPSLKENYRLAILSDCPQDKMELIKRETEMSFFDQTLFSCECNILKNKPDIFLRILNKLHLNPDECLFVDDESKNIQLAKTMGFKVCKYQKLEDLDRIILKEKRLYES